MGSTKQLKAGVVLSYLTLALSNIIALVYTPFMLRMMGQSEYGLYSLVASVVAYLTILDFGFGNAIVRYTAKYRAESKLEEQYSMFGQFFLLYMAIGLFTLLVGGWLYCHVDTLFAHSMTLDEVRKARVMVLLMVANVALSFPLSVFPAIIMAYEDFIFHKIVNLVRIVLQPCLMIPLLLMGHKAIGMVVLMSVLNLLTLLVYCWYCFFRLRIKVYFQNFDRSLLKEISTYSFFVFLTIIVDRAFWSTGQFILGMLSGTKEVAIYAIVVQLCNYYMNFSLAISGVFLPKMTQLVAEGRSQKEISDLFIKIGRIQFIVLGYILLGFVLFGKPFVCYWAGPGYEQVYPLAIVLMVPQTIPLIQNLGISVLQAQNRQKFRSFLNLSVSLISVFIGYGLTKVYGIFGCAISTSAALLIGHGFILNCYYHIRIHLDLLSFWIQILRLAIPIILATAIVGFFMYCVGIESILLLFVAAIVYTLLCALFLWRFGCNSFEKEQIIVPIQKIKTKIMG